ncbi:phage tail sheath subtilisin-like domain-containing protein [Alteraurantiacibacter aquimixticola]|uniref:Uncharacterized protein n=1 Tax=Alteraurantiacibacter aquimixticola TaxID=2489173 RepID=A0A4T3EYF2_9SPHN|nr:phage tail sheath subtilisin-like domain-containing protein [Alteraurantiacibacter aquimixticola]TIX49636.1 hypothetical protein E5222_12460 [Alteraurantiacibacter aquimixticola]
MATGLNPGAHASWQRKEAPPQVRIDVPAFIGIAERGPLGAAVSVESWLQFTAVFGSFLPNAFLAQAVRAFFENGGERCFVARVAAGEIASQTAGVQPTDRSSSVVADAAGFFEGVIATLRQRVETVIAGLQPADRATSVVAATTGLVPGDAVILLQSGTAPVQATIRTLDPVAQSIAWEQPLPITLDLTQPIIVRADAVDERVVQSVSGSTVHWHRPLDLRFSLAAPIDIAIGCASAAASAVDAEGREILYFGAASAGRWGNRLTVRLTTSLDPEIATRRLSVPDLPDRLTLDRLDQLRPGSTVEIAQDGATTARNEIADVDRTELRVKLLNPLIGFDPLAAANGTKPIRVRRLALTVSVRERGRLVETHPALDLPRITEPDNSPVNERSRFIRIRRLPGTSLGWPDPDSPLMRFGELHPTGGRDGIALLQSSDFTGSADASPVGMRLFEDIDEPAALAMPDIVLPAMAARETLAPEPDLPDPCNICAHPTPPLASPAGSELVEATPGFGEFEVLAIQQAMVEHCEARGDRIAILDPPLSPDQRALDWPRLASWRQRFDSSYAATYFPWIGVVDPLGGPNAELRLLPPSGHVLGQIAAADRDPGSGAPANRWLAWTSAVQVDFDDGRHAILNETGINAITSRPGRGIRVMGARTLASNSLWKQLAVRRQFLRLKRLISKAMAWTVFEPANVHFERCVFATLEGLLEQEWQSRRLAGNRAEEAFRIAIARSAADIDDGRFVVHIAVAPVFPAEFVLLRLVRSHDRLQLAESTATGGWPT